VPDGCLEHANVGENAQTPFASATNPLISGAAGSIGPRSSERLIESDSPYDVTNPSSFREGLLYRRERFLVFEERAGRTLAVEGSKLVNGRGIANGQPSNSESEILMARTGVFPRVDSRCLGRCRHLQRAIESMITARFNWPTNRQTGVQTPWGIRTDLRADASQSKVRRLSASGASQCLTTPHDLDEVLAKATP
jgi:hypothetical protein